MFFAFVHSVSSYLLDEEEQILCVEGFEQLLEKWEQFLVGEEVLKLLCEDGQMRCRNGGRGLSRFILPRRRGHCLEPKGHQNLAVEEKLQSSANRMVNDEQCRRSSENAEDDAKADHDQRGHQRNATDSHR